jgi:hypothetical protein
VFDAWMRFQQHLSPEGAQAIEEFALDHQTPALPATVEALGTELDSFEFLREPYAPGEDVVGDLWEEARAQRDRGA